MRPEIALTTAMNGMIDQLNQLGSLAGSTIARLAAGSVEGAARRALEDLTCPHRVEGSARRACEEMSGGW